ncbi:TerD family protein [Salipiger marinus]|uniref:Tellurium resistance protein TerZ n=1 Tax=Salipiger marinus TaxID=555512 RepID=A0A1G8UJZ6_9RHOB|nr:TerD family protein [Salipiger marinus]SDJ54138.1 tellurium resistance protein TerZ [Salipiger marinus]
MSISLSKGQTISLSKDQGLSRVFMGCGWDPAQPPQKGGLLGKIFGGSKAAEEIDLDASVIVFDGNKRKLDTVWFRQLQSSDGSIRHSGDNLTGEGDGDDEIIHVNLAGLDPDAHYLAFTVNSFRGQTFNEVDNAFARLVDETTGKEICKYALREQGPHTGVIMASMTRTASGWQLTAYGRPTNGRTAEDLAAVAAAVL